MTNDEIAKLAREYVEQSAEEVGTKLDPESWAFDCMMTQAKDVINFLLRTHRIIKKSKLGEAYYIAKYNYDNAESDRDKELALAKKEMLDFIIPESTKEVEL